MFSRLSVSNVRFDCTVPLPLRLDWMRNEVNPMQVCSVVCYALLSILYYGTFTVI